MSRYNNYLVEDLFSSIANIKVLKIYGDLEFNRYRILRKTYNAIREFLNKNKDVDFLIAYFFPTREDLFNDAALCFLKLDIDIINFDLITSEDFSNKLCWNEDYGFFSAVVKKNHSSDFRIVKEIHSMLNIIEEACLIIYNIDENILKTDICENVDFFKQFEDWIIKAEHFDNFDDKLDFVVKDFRALGRHMGNIFYCCFSDVSRDIIDKESRQWIFKHEIANAKDKLETLRHNLSYLLRKNLK